MQIIPQSVHILDTNDLQLHKFSAQSKSSQHGHPHSDSVDTPSDAQGFAPLLAIPSESLTHITAFLDPLSLFALGRTNKVLHEHIDDDNTWHRAFAYQFLGERPETSDLQQSILMRRSEDTWKREFVLRCNLIRRWERCRNGTVSHTPHYSPVMAMHLLSDRSYGPALLSVSLQYGVVARSFPLSGKVLKGFLAASDGFGMGIGNPNAEFTPNVSSCAVASEGWTARIAFGFTNGEVALASAMRVMETGRTTSKVVRCRVNEQHRGPVADVAWDGMAFVTAGVDGEVHVWDAKRMRCAWVLRDQESLIPDACVRVLADFERGIVLATKKSGTSVIWVGLSLADDKSELNVMPPKIRIPAPNTVTNENAEPFRIFIDHSTPLGFLSFGIHFMDEMHFFRVNVDLISGQLEFIRFGDGPLAPIQAIFPFFTSMEEGGQAVIFVGDALGRVSLFDWSSKPEVGRVEVSSSRRLDAYLDEVGVSALACNLHVLAVGSARGGTKIYDTLTLRLLREFPSPIPRPDAATNAVKQIILERDLLLVAVGERILAWEAKPVRPHKPLTTLKKGSAKGRNAKWHKRFELAQDITESRKAAEEAHASEQRTHQRRRAQQATLAGLGLDEHEALEYVLMLSRDEEAHHVRHDEGVFEASFDDIPLAPSASQSNSRSEEYPASNPSPPLRLMPSPSTSLAKVQVSPPLRPEPMEAGGLGSSPLGLGMAARRSTPPSLEDSEHFPAMSSSASSVSSLPPMSHSSSWSARLKSPSLMPSMSVPATPASDISARRSISGPSSSGPSLLSENISLDAQAESGGRLASETTLKDADEEMDADLKLALELSLAEALSLEQN